MKKSLRFALVAAVLLSFASLPSYATLDGGNPHPQVAAASTFSVAASVILSVLGL
ncbi:MAG: hypothetical protein ABR906_01300 [Terracidiphilus sp.]|jgi:uncharacterized membrane protein